MKPKAGEGEYDKVDVKVWDTAGQERFHTITQQFYK
jgi:GTPase SAR1 family protein